MNDLEFIQNCLKGDKQSWLEFISRYSRLIYNYIYSVLSVKGCSIPTEQVEDIYQEIFHILIKDNYKKLSTYQAKNGCTLASWLRQVTTNLLLIICVSLGLWLLLYEHSEEGLGLADTLADLSAGAAEFLSDQDKRKT